MISAQIGSVVYRYTTKLSNDEAETIVRELTELFETKIRQAEAISLQRLLSDVNLRKQIASEQITIDD